MMTPLLELGSGPDVRLAFLLSLVLFGVWMLWSGHTEPLLVVLGAASAVAVALVSRRMGLVDREGVPSGLVPRAPRFLLWLLVEVVKANVDVARRILDPRLPIRPHLIRVRASQRTDVGRVIYANSITLTPGTVSVEVEGDVIVVHALSDEAADGLRTGDMDRRV